MLDGQARLAADGVAKLCIQVLVDHVEVVHRVGGEVHHQGVGEGVCPDGTRDRRADGASDGSNDVEQREGGGDVAVVDGGEDGDLLDDDEDGAADGDKDLAHDLVPDGLVRATEVDHEALGEDVQRYSDVQQPLKPPSPTHQVSDQKEQDTRDHVEGVVDVPGLGEGDVVDDLQVRGEVVVPAVVSDLVGGVEQAGADDGAVGEEVEIQQGLGREELLVEGEGEQQDEADDQHGDDVACCPAVGGRAGDVEWEEEDHQAHGEEDHSECC